MLFLNIVHLRSYQIFHSFHSHHYGNFQMIVSFYSSTNYETSSGNKNFVFPKIFNLNGSKEKSFVKSQYLSKAEYSLFATLTISKQTCRENLTGTAILCFTWIMFLFVREF